MMKTRNKIIVFLAIIGIILVGLVQGVIIPKYNHRTNHYIAEQQNPITHDLNSILKYKNKYMGNSSNITNLFYNLPLNNIPMSFQLFPDKLAVEVNYKDNIGNVNESKVNKALIYNSTAAFALIENLQVITYNFTGSKYKVLRSDVEKWYDTDLALLLKKDAWKNKVQRKLQDNGYVDNCIKSVLKKQ